MILVALLFLNFLFQELKVHLLYLRENFLMEDKTRKSFFLHHFRNPHLVFGLLAYDNLLEYDIGSAFFLKLTFPRVYSSLVESVLAILIGKFFDSKLKPKIIRIYSNVFFSLFQQPPLSTSRSITRFFHFLVSQS